MKHFGLQKLIFQLFNTLKSQFCACELFSDTAGCSKQLNKTHNFRKNHFCDHFGTLYCIQEYILQGTSARKFILCI